MICPWPAAQLLRSRILHANPRKGGTMGMVSEFREFALKGSVMDLAIGIVIGAAFAKIVDSLVADIIMPLVGLLLGGVDFRNIFVTLRGGPFETLEAARAANAPTLNLGLFLNEVVTFIIVAFSIFLVIRAINRMRRRNPPPVV
jgi:large conductance mechanosensitive channel